jgi:CheY-like chemotaxis protein
MPIRDLPTPPRILVVEDEFLIRLTLVEALGDEGFEVVEAESGDAGLLALQADGSIQLLLTDIQLPGSLDGRGLARRARETRPELPIIYMTGRPDPAAEAAATPNERYIAKPYTLNDICKAVRDLLNV